jgi:glycosyltransferase involved in cell wall biosynthesis
MTQDALRSGDSFAVSAPQLGVRRYTVPYFDIHPITAPAGYRELEGRQLERLFTDLVAQDRPDVVIAGRPSFAWHVPKLAAANKLPCVVIAHGTLWIDLLQGKYGRARSREMLTEFRRASRIVVPAHHLAQGLQASGLETVRVVPNPVDVGHFRPRERDRQLASTLGIADGDLVLMHASNLSPLKRPLDIVYSAERVLAEAPRTSYLIVGDGPCRRDMEAACAARGVSDRFRFLGWVDYGRMPECLDLADIVLMASETEGQSLACLEAQASGRALLASDIPGAREIVTDGETGILFECGNIEDMTAKTLLLTQRPDLRRRIGEQARQRVCRHSLPDVARGYDTALAELAQSDPY